MSFILRKVLKDGTQTNILIGNQYRLIERDVNYDQFSEAFEKEFEKFHVADLDPESDSFSKNCYAFLIVNEGSLLIPMYKNQWNYIMTDSGKTFANLSYK